MNFRKAAADGLKGFSMGAGVFPGVSAGTIALMTGIFQPLIDSLNALLTLSNWKMLFKGDVKGFWKAINGQFLLAVGVGMILGFLILARLVKWALDYYPSDGMQGGVVYTASFKNGVEITYFSK